MVTKHIYTNLKHYSKCKYVFLMFVLFENITVNVYNINIIHMTKSKNLLK